ncbi:hypothetical protein OSB04_009872 [Centaurea solstitialis]|uniref:S-protein homolog n=1 Tax=Centaurea solstitialis TaxID=347529 RepID=A0AA38TE01_9ASTR|nr:hypothetical protein OSB04_009872 [Centaurea solstitialis]
MPNIFIVLFLFFIPTFSLDYPLNCFLEPQWHMFVTCDLPQQLQFSITDTNTENDVTLSFGQTYDWYFCPDGKYIGDFKWGSKHQNVELFRSDDYDNVCHRFKFGTIHCYWLVTPDGFYVSKHNVPYPNSDWHFVMVSTIAMCSLFVLIFLIISTSSITYVTPTSSVNDCVLLTRWHVFVTNGISENISVHIRSKDDDLGNRTLPYNGSFDWSFCDTGRTLFYSQFRWGSKYQTLNLFDANVWRKCDKGKFGTQHCYWLVRPEGFYISRGIRGFAPTNPDKLRLNGRATGFEHDIHNNSKAIRNGIGERVGTKTVPTKTPSRKAGRVPVGKGIGMVVPRGMELVCLRMIWYGVGKADVALRVGFKYKPLFGCEREDNRERDMWRMTRRHVMSTADD